MLPSSVIEDAARRLDEAEKNRNQIPQLSLEHPEITIEDAYEIQRCWIALKCDTGRSVKGHKVGLTSKAMQRTSQIDEPDYGTLLDDMFFEDGARIPVGRFIEPRVEMEIAFVIGERIKGPQCTAKEVLEKSVSVVPAIEIIDARIERFDRLTKRPRKVMDTISDNAANAGVVLGSRCIEPSTVDLKWASAILHRNSDIEESGVAAAVLGHPANGVAWLANRLAGYGVGLEEGQVILSGSFVAPVSVRAGDVFSADYRDLGVLSFTFV